MSVYMSVCVGMQVDWSRQTVNLLPQGKLVGLNPTRHTKLWGFSLTGKTLCHNRNDSSILSNPALNLHFLIILLYFQYGGNGNHVCIYKQKIRFDSDEVL